MPIRGCLRVAKQLAEGLRLYHGSYVEVHEPDLERCARFKDFGRGFYLTSSPMQARSFARLSTRKARDNGLVPMDRDFGFVSTFRVQGLESERLSVHVYEDADEEWLKCIASHRRRGAFVETLAALKRYDVIAGKVANDQTNNTLATYLSGGYGPFESPRSIELCISLLLPNRLEDQYCFRTKRALRTLMFERSEAVWL